MAFLAFQTCFFHGHDLISVSRLVVEHYPRAILFFMLDVPKRPLRPYYLWAPQFASHVILSFMS